MFQSGYLFFLSFLKCEQWSQDLNTVLYDFKVYFCCYGLIKKIKIDVSEFRFFQ